MFVIARLSHAEKLEFKRTTVENVERCAFNFSDPHPPNAGAIGLANPLHCDRARFARTDKQLMVFPANNVKTKVAAWTRLPSAADATTLIV
jgi:hypothetical protein